MSHYGPPANNTAFPRGTAPALRGPPPAYPHGMAPPFLPPFHLQGPPPSFAFHGPPPQFHGPRPPLQLNLTASLNYPAPPSPASPPSILPFGWQESRTPQGALYYYNATTGVSTFDLPTSDSSTWVEYKDEATGASYYFNTVTRETVWDQPEEFRMQKAREQVAKMTSEALLARSPVNSHVETPRSLPPTNQLEQQERDEEETKQLEAQAHGRQTRKEVQEQQQAAEFTDMPRTERLAAFKQFLEEKQIPPTLKWGDAQRLIGKETSLQSDARWKFALQTVGEKKQAYAEYCTQAKNRLTIEKRRLVKKAREEFIELLGLFETTLAPSRRQQVSWDEVNESNTFYALRNDARWIAIEEVREKQQLFTAFIQDLERNQKARLVKQRDALKSGFFTLLRQRVEAKELDFESRLSKRLDSDLKRRVLEMLEEVTLSDGQDKVGEDALRIVDRHDVYDWTEEFVRERREFEHAKRKRERVERAERTKRLELELSDRLKELASCGKLTVGSTWDEFASEYLKEASEQIVKERKKEDGVTEDDEEEQDAEHLHWKTQRRIFDKFVRRLRCVLEPMATVIRACLDRNEPTLRVMDTTLFAVYVDALRSGVRKTTESNATEEGEEKMETSKKIAKVDEVETLDPNKVTAALETAVKAQGDSDDVVFPEYVRQVYDMWVAMAKEDRRREAVKKGKRRKRSHKESHDENEEEHLRRSRRRSSTADENEEDKSHRKRRSRRSSRKRRHSHASSSASRSRSKSRRSSRRTHSHSRSRDRACGLPPSLAAVNVKPTTDRGTEKPLSPLRTPSKLLSEAEEAAKAEEIIRQARLKMQVQGKTSSDDDELEEGEEVEEGEE